MPGIMRKENRRWKVFYLCHDEICGDGHSMPFDEAFHFVCEEYEGQKAGIKKTHEETYHFRRGDYFKGNRFLMLCVS